MKQSEISGGGQPDAQLLAQEVRERVQLWRVAEGHLGWPNLVAGLLPLLLVVLGIAFRAYEYGLAGFMGRNPGSYFILLGMGLFGLRMWGNTQRQIGALRDLIKSLERS